MEGGHTKGRDARFRPSGDHDIGVATADDLGSLADDMGPGRTGTDDAVARTAEVEENRCLARRHVRQHVGCDEGAHTLRPLLEEREVAIVERREAADTGSDQDPGPQHARGATILAEVAGYGMTTDAYHISAPAEGGEGAARSMQLALDKAGLRPDEIDYINAHGTSTPLNDKSETEAIKKVFGEYAYDVPISSTKSMIGHMLGAAGTIEAAVCVRTMVEGIIHPTINLDTPDPDCDLDYVPWEPRRQTVRTSMSNSFGFGGHNATVVLKRFEG